MHTERHESREHTGRLGSKVGTQRPGFFRSRIAWLTNWLHRLSQLSNVHAEHRRESDEPIRMIAENLHEVIWISDPGHTIQYYLSPAYEKIWGRSTDEARYNPRSFLEAVHSDDRAGVEAALHASRHGEYNAEYRIVRPDGEIRWISARGYPVYDEHGELFRIAGIAEDVTDLKRVEAEREQLLESERQARAETEAALRIRDRVLRIVSHDLKNPLHTIGMAADLLEMPLGEERRTQQIDIIRRTVSRAHRLIVDLLDAARVQSGQAIAIVPQAQSTNRLVGEAVEAFRLQAEAKQQRLLCEVSDEVGVVFVDHDRMLQALTNLIGNAVKFTPGGGQICVRAEPVKDSGVRFSVSDTGPGIPSEILPQIFKPFTQAKDSATLGTGLGLSIANGIVEAHGGSIAVQSEEGSGTTFHFVIPALRDHPTPGRDGD